VSKRIFWPELRNIAQRIGQRRSGRGVLKFLFPRLPVSSLAGAWGGMERMRISAAQLGAEVVQHEWFLGGFGSVQVMRITRETVPTAARMLNG
jgi:hypothetical protein